MLWTLFLKECRQMLKCLTYYVIIICMLLMYSTQLGAEEIRKPQPGQENYGVTMSKNESVIMKMTIINLAREYVYNSYGTYPIGFYKTVKLNTEKKEKMGAILSEVTGIEKEKLDSMLESYVQDKYYVDSDGNEVYMNSSTGEITGPSDADGENDKNDSSGEVQSSPDAESGTVSITLEAAQGLSYERFTELMTKADKLLGGGSSYAKERLQSNAYVMMTYEQALEEYNNIVEKDHLTGAYARLFSDYMGVVLAILPVFLAVTRGLRDRRAKAAELIGSRSAPSFHIMISRYLAMVVMLLLPVLILGGLMSIECINTGVKEGIAIDYLAFPKYILGWLLPSIMISTAVGVILTELTDTAIAIIVQGFWWFISVSTGGLSGNCGWNLVPRHNSTGYYDEFMENFGQLVRNRIAYAAAALLLLMISVYIYDKKRKGWQSIGRKIFPNRKSKSEA